MIVIKVGIADIQRSATDSATVLLGFKAVNPAFLDL